MRKPSVAIVHYSAPPVIGGVERVIDAHARRFAEAGLKTRLIVGKGGLKTAGVENVVIPEIASQGGPLRGVLKALRRGTVPSGFEDDVGRTERKLARALRGIDVCMLHNVLTMHFNLVLTAALANLMRRQHGTRFIGWIHDAVFVDSDYETHQRSEYPWSLMSRALEGCRYCAISGHRQRQVADLFGQAASDLPVIPDGIDVPELMGLTPRVTGLFHGRTLYNMDFVALTPTRIVRRKHLEAGLHIVRAIRDLDKSIRWLVTGAPDPHNPDAQDYYSELLALRDRLGIEEEAVFLCEDNARVTNRDLWGLYSLADILIYPSRNEGFGLPVLEAGLAELIMVISDIPALREVGREGEVYFRETDDPHDIAQRILATFVKSPRMVFRKRLIRKYSWDGVFRDGILPAVLDPDSVWKPAAGAPR